MYTIEQYLNDTKLLANSLVIKHHNIGVLINMGLKEKYGIDPPDNLREWKYYLNLAGEQHFDNQPVEIRLVETGEVVTLTKAVLDQYPATRDDLDARLDSYKALIQKYPSEIEYINGCINPVDIDTAINAEDGTVISYSKKYIEEQELSIISELSEKIKNYFFRWYIPEYNITDELYFSSVLQTLYQHLPNIIFNLRLKRVFTSEVHSFHLEHFFRSHLDIWDGVKNLNKTTIMWLYRNLVYLMNNTGKSKTLNLIVDKILTPNNIGLGTYKLVSGGITSSDTINVMESIFKLNEPLFVPEGLNNAYNKELEHFTIEDVVYKEIKTHDTLYSKEDIILLTLTNKVKDDIGKFINLIQNTKILDFGKIEIFKFYNRSLIETILDNWLYLSYMGKYTTNKKLIDPNTKDVMILSPYEGVILFYYLVLRKFGNDNIGIDGIKYINKLRYSITREQLEQKLLPAKGNDYIIDLILRYLPNDPGVLKTTSDFNNHIKQNIGLFSKVWLLDSNVNNNFLSANIKNMVSRLFDQGKIYLQSDHSVTNLKSYLESLNIDIDITETYNIDKMLTYLFKEFTGFDIDEKLIVEDLYRNYKNMLDKLTSYTVKILPPNIELSELKISYSTPAVNQTLHGFIDQVNGNIIKVLEDNNGIVYGKGNNFIEKYKAIHIEEQPNHDFDAFNHIRLMSNDELVDKINPHNVSYGVSVETLHASYIKYHPDTRGYGNSADESIHDIKARIGGHIGSLSYGMDRDDNTYIIRQYNNGIYNTYIENLGLDINPYTPDLNSVGNNNTNRYDLKVNTINIVNGSSLDVDRNDGVYAYDTDTVNNSYVENIGVGYKPYSPLMSGGGSTSYISDMRINTIPSVYDRTNSIYYDRNKDTYVYEPDNINNSYVENLGVGYDPYSPDISGDGTTSHISDTRISTISNPNDTLNSINYDRDNNLYTYTEFKINGNIVENIGVGYDPFGPDVTSDGNVVDNTPTLQVSEVTDPYVAEADPDLITEIDEVYSDQPSTDQEPGTTVTETVK